MTNATESPVTPVETPPIQPVGREVKQREVAKYFQVALPVIAGSFVLGIAAFADIAALRYGKEISDAVIAASGVIATAATIVIAKFTQRLFESTDDIRKGGDATVRVMADQQKAMEAQVAAMGAIAKSVAESAEAAKGAALLVKEQLAMVRRQHVANNLPSIEVEVIQIDYRDDTSLYLHFRVGNLGNTVARITACQTRDGFHQGNASNPAVWGEPIREHPRIAGETLPHGERLPGVHTCTKMNLAYHGVSSGSSLLGDTRLLFDVLIAYDDEVGDHRGADIHFIYELLTRRFIRIPSLPVNHVE